RTFRWRGWPRSRASLVTKLSQSHEETCTAGRNPRRPFRFGAPLNANSLRADTFVRGLGKLLRKPNRILRGAMRLIMLQPLAALGHRRNVADRNPPQAAGRVVRFLKPLDP